MLNPHLIGREASTLELDCDDVKRKPSMIAQIGLVEGVVLILDFHERGLRVLLYHGSKQELDRKVRLIGSICGSQDVVQWMNGFAKCSLRLKDTDWKILREVRKDPRSRMSDVANKLGVSIRTVKRRLSAMAQGSAFYLLPRVNFKKFPGTGFTFLLFCPDSKKKEAADAILRLKLERTIYLDTGAREYSTFAVACDTVAEADEIHQKMKDIDGVKDVRMNAVRDMVFTQDWFDQVMEERLLDAR